MNYFEYLKKKFSIYVISGIVLAVASFMAVSFHRYDNHLFNILSGLQTIGLNKNKIQDKVEEIDSIVSHFKSTYQIDITAVNAQKHILRVLDKMKDHMPDAKITATKFNREAGTMLLPVEIQLRIENYNMLVHTVEYLDTFRVPDYKINILKIAEGSPGELTLLINGTLSMPGFE